MTTATKTTFKKLTNGSWGIKGSDLRTGETVAVHKRDGSVKQLVVGTLLHTDEFGVSVAEIDSRRKVDIERSKDDAFKGRKPGNWVVEGIDRVFSDFEEFKAWLVETSELRYTDDDIKPETCVNSGIPFFDFWIQAEEELAFSETEGNFGHPYRAYEVK